MIKITGGRAHLKGVSIYSDLGYATVIHDKKDKSFKVQSGRYRKNESKIGKIISFIGKIPFLRSFLLIYSLVKKNKKLMAKTVVFYFILVSAIFIILDMNSMGLSENTVDGFNKSMPWILLSVGGLFIKFSSLSNYHGAEHMVINNYIKNGYIDIKNLENETRVSNSCGTTLVTIVFIVFFILSTFIKNSDLNSLLSYMIGYEIFKTKSKVFSPIYFISGMFQKYLLTSKPNKKQLEVAVVALSKSIRKV